MKINHRVNLLILNLLLAFMMMAYTGRTYADSFNTGLIELNSKNYDLAIAHFQQALQQDPYNIKAYNNLGMALKMKGDFNNAILAYQQAIKIDPRYGNAYYNLGLCLQDAGRPEEAVESLQAFINFNPEDSDAIRSKWIANDLRDGIDNIDQQRRKYYLGSYLISDRNYENALNPLEEAVNIDPDDIKARYALGLVKKRTGDLNGAIEQFYHILQANNQHALAYYELGECYEQLGDTNAAFQAYQNYSSLAPYATSTNNLKTKMMTMQQQTQTAQQQAFYQNTLAQNNPAYLGMQQPAQQNPVTQYNQQPVSSQMPSQGMVPGITSAPSYINNSPGSASVPGIGQSQSFGTGMSGPSFGTPAARTGRTRVGVLDFDYSSVRPWWNGQWDIGKGVASLITGELVRSGAYSVIERSALDQVLQEQKLSNTSLFDPTTAATVGKLVGVDILVMGNITQFGIEDKKSGIGSAIPVVSIVANIQSKRSIASVAFDMRMVDVDTGEILEVATVIGKSKRRGLLMDFAKGGNAGGIDFSSSNFQDSVLGEASIASAQKAAEIVNSKYEKLTRATMDTSSQDIGVVAYVDAQGVILNAGSQAGLKVGNRLSIERLTNVVKDPISGRIIKALTAKIGEFEVTEVEAASSTGRMISGSTPQVGDLARYRQDMNVVVPKDGASTSVTAEILYKKNKDK